MMIRINVTSNQFLKITLKNKKGYSNKNAVGKDLNNPTPEQEGVQWGAQEEEGDTDAPQPMEEGDCGHS